MPTVAPGIGRPPPWSPTPRSPTSWSGRPSGPGAARGTAAARRGALASSPGDQLSCASAAAEPPTPPTRRQRTGARLDTRRRRLLPRLRPTGPLRGLIERVARAAVLSRSCRRSAEVAASTPSRRGHSAVHRGASYAAMSPCAEAARRRPPSRAASSAPTSNLGLLWGREILEGDTARAPFLRKPCSGPYFEDPSRLGFLRGGSLPRDDTATTILRPVGARPAPREPSAPVPLGVLAIASGRRRYVPPRPLRPRAGRQGEGMRAASPNLSTWPAGHQAAKILSVVRRRCPGACDSARPPLRRPRDLGARLSISPERPASRSPAKCRRSEPAIRHHAAVGADLVRPPRTTRPSAPDALAVFEQWGTPPHAWALACSRAGCCCRRRAATGHFERRYVARHEPRRSPCPHPLLYGRPLLPPRSTPASTGSPPSPPSSTRRPPGRASPNRAARHRRTARAQPSTLYHSPPELQIARFVPGRQPRGPASSY